MNEMEEQIMKTWKEHCRGGNWVFKDSEMETDAAGLKNTEENVAVLDSSRGVMKRGQGQTQGSCQGFISHSEDSGCSWCGMVWKQKSVTPNLHL